MVSTTRRTKTVLRTGAASGRSVITTSVKGRMSVPAYDRRRDGKITRVPIRLTTMTKDLKDKAVSIKGKLYVPVAERVLYFNETYAEDGCISTELISEPDAPRVVVKATVSIGDRKWTGHSQAVVGEGMVNKTAALENAETSAVGRALAMMGIGVIESIASVDEIRKATNDDF